jgi:hypothetical protein
VKEGTRPTEPLTQVAAFIDGENRPILFSFVEGNLPSTRAARKFRIDKHTGKIYLREALDYETTSNFKLMVLARTKGGKHSSTCFVKVRVLNINDNPPVFHSKQYKLSIAEDTKLGSNLVQVLASDADDPMSKYLQYSLVENPSRLFLIDKSTGWLKLRKPLDREKTAKHILQVEVVDPLKNEPAKFNDLTTITIDLIDVNDSPPTFTDESLALQIKVYILRYSSANRCLSSS